MKGTLRGYLEDQFEAYDNDNAVIFLGLLCLYVMSELYKSVVSTINVSDTEPVGLFLLETAIFEKPLISIDKEYVSSVLCDFYRTNNLTSKDLRAGIRSAKNDYFGTVPDSNLHLSKTWKEFLHAHD